MEDIFNDIYVYWYKSIYLILKYSILKYIDIGFKPCKLHFILGVQIKLFAE